MLTRATRPREVLVLGGGVSGLATAHFLNKVRGSSVNVTLVEKSSRLGGWVRTLREDDFVLEQGPRGVRPSGAPGRETMHLIQQLGLADEVVVSDSAAKRRYIWLNGRLEEVPSSLPAFLRSPLTSGLATVLFRERSRMPLRHAHDESIHDFFSRRFSTKMAETLIDPVISGVYAGDPRKLSIKSCFPSLWKAERESGSVTSGILAQLGIVSKKSPHPPPPVSSWPPLDPKFEKKLKGAALISFKHGMDTLTEAMAKNTNARVLTKRSVQKLSCANDKVSVLFDDGSSATYDHVFSALPAPLLAPLLESQHADTASKLRSIQYADIAVVSVGFKQRVLPFSGFGHLCPSMEGQGILGMVWDSCTFPGQQEHSPEQTRLTVMIGGARMKERFPEMTEAQFIDLAVKYMKKHLGIAPEIKPDLIKVMRGFNAIAQYNVGHDDTVTQLEQQVARYFPRLSFTGSSFYGVGVNDCILHARQIVDKTSLR
eukprot:tig00000402_g226.t1